MKKILAAAALVLAIPVMAQQADRQGDIAAAARIYGYDLAAGNWTHSRARCAAIPGSTLVRYVREYPDGTESILTAIVPNDIGYISIVPVLYHGASPFVPAPRNPRNIALFNHLVSAPRAGVNNEKHFLALASCYAEMTGGIDPLTEPGANFAIAGQPAPTVRMSAHDKTAIVIFGERDASHRYQVWSVGFNHRGKVASAQVEEESVYAPKIARSNSSAAPAESTVQSVSTQRAPEPHTSQLSEVTAATSSRPARQSTSQEELKSVIEPEQTANAAGLTPVASSGSEAENASASESQTASQPESQPGWKPVLNAAQPPSKFVANAPPPAQKFVPNPPAEPGLAAPSSQPEK